jgi:hypothetical protein
MDRRANVRTALGALPVVPYHRDPETEMRTGPRAA